MDNRSLSHTCWKCQYHIVFIPKYRKKVLYGKLRQDVREIISILCKYKNVDFFAKFRTYVLALTATKEGENFYERKISKYCYSVF